MNPLRTRRLLTSQSQITNFQFSRYNALHCNVLQEAEPPVYTGGSASDESVKNPQDS
jgi:hypothetical protein